MSAIAAAEPSIILEVEVGEPVDVGALGAGSRRVIPLKGGRCSGALEGDVLPGADWQIIHDDGNLDIEAHYAIRTKSGAAIEVQSNGVRTGSPDIMKRLMAGEVVDPSRYYFRTVVRMRTGAPDLADLNFKLFIARGARHKGYVRLELFEVL
jgi:hypothetical protein